jgi:hypothetical protein
MVGERPARRPAPAVKTLSSMKRNSAERRPAPLARSAALHRRSDEISRRAIKLRKAEAAAHNNANVSVAPAISHMFAAAFSVTDASRSGPKVLNKAASAPITAP